MARFCLLSLLLLCLLAPTVRAQVNDCECDVVLVLDASGSIPDEDFVKVKAFATTVVSSLNKGGKIGPAPNQSKVGIVTFSDEADLVVPMSTNAQTVLNAIPNIKKTSGTTQTDVAIDKAVAALAYRDADDCVTIKLLTDGNSNEPDKTAAAAARAKAANITIVVVGIGYAVNTTELNLMASEPKQKNSIEIDDFNGLDQVAHALYDRCNNPSPPALNVSQSCECDVVIVLDSSGSISVAQWQFMKDFAAVFAHAYRSRLAAKQIRMGLVIYSDTARLVVPLTYDYGALTNGIASAPRIALGTNTHLGIDLARVHLMQNQDPKQNNTCNMMKVVTDGRSNSPPLTADAAYKAKSRDQIDIVAVGVGTGILKSELTAIASVPLDEHMFILADFNNLTALAHKLADKCDDDIDSPTPTIPDDVCHCDLFLVLDGSGSIDNTEWNQVQNFARNMVENVRRNLAPNDIRVTIVQFGTAAKTVVKFSSNYNELIGATTGLRTGLGVPGQTNTHLALDMVRTLIENDPGSASKCKSIKVVSDGVSTNAALTANAAHKLKKVDDAVITAIGVGNGINQQELNVMASPPVKDNTLLIQFADLSTLAKKLSGPCDKTDTPSPKLKTLTPPQAPVDDCDCDVVIVLDASGSITAQQWVQMTDFTRTIVREMSPVLGPNKARIGVISYSTTAETVSALSSDPNQLLFSVNSMKQSRGTTNTHLGILAAATEILRSPRARTGKCKTIKVVTDGRSSIPAQTATAAKYAKANGIYMVAIGVGAADAKEMALIASAPIAKNAIYLKDFSGLDDVAHAISAKCNPQGTRTADYGGQYSTCHCDYALVLDASLSIGLPNFKQVTQFAVNIVQGLYPYIADNDTRVAIITYAASSSVWLPLTGVPYTALNGANSIPQRLALGTNTAAGITSAGAELVRLSRGLGTCKRMIVVTDGRSGNKAATVAAAHRYKSNYGVQIMAYGIGTGVDKQELENIASNPDSDNVRYITGYTDLAAAATALTGKCNRNTSATPYQADCKCDIALVLDGSGSIRNVDWPLVQSFCSSVVNGLKATLATGEARLAIIEYSTIPKIVSGLSSDAVALTTKCATLVQSKGTTQTHNALYVAGEVLRAGNRGCMALKLLTDGRSANPKATDATAERLKRTYGIVIQAIGIGASINMNELRDVASAPVVNNAIKINDYSFLQSVANQITAKCNNPVFNGGSKCNFNNMVSCTLGKRTPCELVVAYRDCAAKFFCPDMLKIWCETRFLIAGSPYKACAQTTPICNTAAAGSRCNVNGYNACYNQITQLGRVYDYCTRQDRMILCAAGAACPDMVTYNCQQTTSTCRLASCANVPKLATQFEADQLDAIFTPLFERDLSAGPSYAVIALSVMVVVLAAALVVLVIKTRAQSRAVQSQEYALLE